MLKNYKTENTTRGIRRRSSGLTPKTIEAIESLHWIQSSL